MVLLQQIYAQRLHTLLGPQPALPDLFSANLNIPAGQDPLRRLHHLSLRHRVLTDPIANWQDTCIYTAERFLARQAKEGS